MRVAWPGDRVVTARAQLTNRRRWRLVALGVLVISGIVLASLEPVDRGALLDWGRALAADPRAVAGLVAAQALLFSFGLPGSVVFWLIAPFHSPLVATALLVTGSVAGAAGAHRVARFLGSDLQARIRDSGTLQVLRSRSDFLSQCALRVLPGFPHAAINLGGGLLRLPLLVFLLAAAAGLAGKWGLYAWAVHGIVERDGDVLQLGVADVVPLLVLAAFLGVGSLFARRWQRADGRD